MTDTRSQRGQTSSFVVSSKQRHEQLMSSTSSSSTSSTTLTQRSTVKHRRPIRSFHSVGSSSFSSTLDDEQELLATNKEEHATAATTTMRAREQAEEFLVSASSSSPQSAPAALSSSQPPSYAAAAAATAAGQALVIEEEEEEEAAPDVGPLETRATIRLIESPPAQLTANNLVNHVNHTSQLQVAEPIVEVRQTSSSASSASSSPLSSRQSSDCDRAAGQREKLSPVITTATGNSGAHSPNSGSSSSSSSASSSSRRLVRRRTVRRSYHHHHNHRALDTAADKQSHEEAPRSHVVTRTTTTTTRTGGQPQSSSSSSGCSTQQVVSTRLLTPPVAGEQSVSSGSSSHKLSTSRSSSKIATRITSSSSSSTSGCSTHKNSQAASTTSQQSQKQQEERQHASVVGKTMTSSMENLSGIKQQQVSSSSSSTLKQHQDLNRHAESLFERRARGHTLASKFAATDVGEAHQVSMGVHHRSTESLSTSSSFNATASRSLTSGGATTTQAATAAVSSSSAASSSCETSLTRTSATSSNANGGGGGSDLTAALTQRQTSAADRFSSTASSSSSMFLSAAAAAAKQRSFLASPDNLLFSSPDLHSFVQEIGTDFAALANSTSLLVKEHQQQQHLFNHHQTTSRLLLGPPLSRSILPSAPVSGPNSNKSLDSLINETNCTIKELEDNPPARSLRAPAPTSGSLPSGEKSHSAKIQELLDKAQRHGSGGGDDRARPVITTSGTLLTDANLTGDKSTTEPTGRLYDESDRCKAVMNESIVRIEQRMSDLCRKFASCDDTQKAIDLLKIMIQMIEKAWSVPVCGDDLGFKLCNSLRQFGGLDIILGFVREADERSLLEAAGSLTPGSGKSLDCGSGGSCDEGSSSATSTMTRSNQQPLATLVAPPPPKQQLKLNLSGIHGPEVASDAKDHQVVGATKEETPAREDDDSDILTSDLGLDSASVESLSYVSAAAAPPTSSSGDSATTTTAPAPAPSESDKCVQQQQEQLQRDQEEQMQRVRKDELVFLSAHLLSQCLTLENRDYIVQCGHLDPVIKLACNFTTMKSNQSKRLLKRSALMRQSSTMKQQQLTSGAGGAPLDQLAKKEQQVVPTPEQRSDMHSAIGTEILQHLFKHSEETCTRMISLGALQAILYGCRSSHVETLRHCASALANLALYGGPDSQQTMIEQKAHVWLFPLAFNEDDNVQYYACLAIVVLAANQEIEADVLQSSTLDLVEPFVTSHEPRKFAESTTSHIHGQSASWLRKLMPLLDSKREEARNLACFHFAMEAYIKREQGRTGLFQEIGSLEPLRRAGSSPIAIASKFACQALRLIGAEEPHKLSQQVPLWTCEDVCEWVAQVGFERFRSAFRESHVDGDLLLQLDEEMLKFDIGIENGIIRRRFLRELAQLKRIADYSSVDRTQLGHLLMSAAAAAMAALGSTHPTSAGQMGTLSSSRTTGSHTYPHHTTRALAVALGGAGQHQQVVVAAAPTLHHISHATPTSLSGGAQARNARDFLQYIYPIIQLGVTRDNIHLVDCDQLLAECKITNALHRIKLSQAIRELQDQNQMALEVAASQDSSSLLLGGSLALGYQKTLDVFVSYRRSTGSQLASLLKVHLQLRGFSVFIDVERLEAGKFDNNLLDSIKQAKNFILVLSPGALDRCIGDHECKDWVHKEIVAALASNCNIIPIIDNFHWPDGEQLPEDMRSITYFNGIRWIHDYQDACVDKVERFIRGELSNSMGGLGGQSLLGAGSTISSGSAGQQQVAATPASVSAYAQRLGYATTPSIMGPPPPPPPPPVAPPPQAANTTAASSGQNFHNSNTNSASANSGNTNQGDTCHQSTTTNCDEQNMTTNAVAQPAQNSNNNNLAAAHPLANYANPYLQFNSGNVNPNIRLR